MSLRKLLKLKHELDSLELHIQQWGLKLESLIHDKEGKQGEPLIFKEECHENPEVNCNLLPRFDELEIGKLQVSDLEQCGVVEEIEELLSQEECPHSQQELRTILFEERGFDVYFQESHFHSFNSTSWEVNFIQIHAWQGPSLVPLFEFYDKRHFMEFYLNFKVPYPKGFSKWGSRVPSISKLKNCSIYLQTLGTIQPNLPRPLPMIHLLLGSPRRSKEFMPWSEIMFAKRTVNCPVHTGSGPVLFHCWSKIYKGKFPARTTPLKLKILAFQQDLLQGIWSSFGRSTNPKTEDSALQAIIQHRLK